MTDPLAAEAVRCPECAAPPGQPCRGPAGRQVMPHPQRQTAWEATLRPQETPNYPQPVQQENGSYDGFRSTGQEAHHDLSRRGATHNDPAQTPAGGPGDKACCGEHDPGGGQRTPSSRWAGSGVHPDAWLFRTTD